MTLERWETIQKLFHEVADLDDAARTAFLDERCASDAELRRDVEALVHAERRAHGGQAPAITEAIAGVAHGLIAPDAAARAGERVGTYRLLRELGHGGMGAVRAEEPVGRPLGDLTGAQVLEGGRRAVEVHVQASLLEVAGQEGLLDGQREHFLYAWRVGNVTNHFLVRTGSNLSLDLHPYGFEIQTHLLKNIDRHALAQCNQAEQQMLCADEIVTKAISFPARQREHLLGTWGEIAEIHFSGRRVENLEPGTD